MTKVYRRTSLPVLDNSKSVQNPDLLNLADKNYAATILRYANLVLQFPQLKTKEKTIVAAINELKAASGYKLKPAGYAGDTDNLGGIFVGDGLSITEEGILSANVQDIPIASEDTLGGVKVGQNLAITSDGILSATGSELIPATSETLGGIKVGEHLNITTDGKLSVDEEIATTGIHTTTSILIASDWDSEAFSQTITVSGITQTCGILVSANPQYIADYCNFGIFADSQGENVITFMCNEIPDVDIEINIAYWEDDTE